MYSDDAPPLLLFKTQNT
jgi:hypothetical protein